ncbi:MAG: nitrogenase component 1 [Candidatus Omnitrophica bacterium]|nr:nitrogenase component 1 [Candidatus Omnitrophota bacterium]
MDYPENWFYQHHFCCGRSSGKLFAGLMGLSGRSGLRLEAISWKGYFEIRLIDNKSQGLFIIVVKEYKKEEEWMYGQYANDILDNNFIILSRQGESRSDIKSVLSSLRKNLSALTPSELFKAVYNDNNSSFREVANAGPQDKGAPVNFCNSFYEWGNSRMGHTFMLNYSLILDEDHWIGFAQPRHVFLRCGDVECNNSESPLNFRTCGKEYAFPSRGLLHESRGQDLIRGKRSFSKVLLRSAILDLKDEDIIMGTDSKVYEVLNRITREDNIPVNVLYTCVNKVIGTDIISLIKQINKNNKAQVVYTECSSEKNPGEAFAELMRSIKIGVKHKVKDKTYNLIGYKDDRGMAELTQLLGKILGLKLNIRVFPYVDLKTLKDFYKGRLQVLNQMAIYQGVFNNVFKGSDLDTLTPPAPYGIKDSVEWLRSIAGFFKVPLDSNKEWKRYYQGKIREWKALTATARKYRLAFIISGDDVELLTSPAKYPLGVPILRCLEEMGFGLDILLTTDEDPDKHRQTITSFLEGGKKHKIEKLNDPAKIEEWISGSDCRCVYSDFRNDLRIISNGKMQFSASDFQEGLDGALRTLQGLLELCGINFFNRYRRYKQQAKPVLIEGAYEEAVRRF